LLNELKRTVRRQKDKLEKKLSSLEKQGDVSSLHNSFKLKGDLIMSNIHLLKPGSSEIEVENWETGEKEILLLDPLKSGVENAEAYYKQAGKLKRGTAKVLPLIDDCKTDIRYLDETEALLEALKGTENDDITILSQIEAELIGTGFVKKKAVHVMKEKASKKAKKKVQGAEYKRLISPNGFEVLVGRSSLQNDEITMRVAKTGDIWMHARGFPGAHVLIKSSQSASAVHDEDLEFAANLAAYYSKGSNLSKVDVIMADKKDISKPKGAKPGQVLVRKEKVIVAVPNMCVTHNN
jgi:predicted ribosome quality control (RQC) complex YloA/Tae2 family protein